MIKTTKKHNQVFERLEPVKGQEWLKLFAETVINTVTPYVKNKVILDAGCGCGLAEQIWHSRGVKKIDAYDISVDALNFAKKNNQYDNVNFEIKDFNIDVFKENYYDIAVSIEVIEHLGKRGFYLDNIYKSLKRGGLLFLSTPNKERSLGINKFHIKEFDYQEMIDFLITKNFKIIKSIGIEMSLISSIGGKYFPQKLISLIKKMPFYYLFLKLFCNFKKKNPEDSFVIIYIAKKL